MWKIAVFLCVMSSLARANPSKFKVFCDQRQELGCYKHLQQEMGPKASARDVAQEMCVRYQMCDELSKLNKKDPNALYCKVPRTEYGPNGKQVSSGFGKSFYALNEAQCKEHCDRQWSEELEELKAGHTLKAACRVGKSPADRDIVSYSK
jgi:hypothetical protein